MESPKKISVELNEWLEPLGIHIGESQQYLAAILVAAIIIVWKFFPKLYALYKKKTGGLFITDSNICNIDSKRTPFKISTAFLPSGQLIEHKIVHHQFYLGVENLSDKTIRNVRFVIESINKPGQSIHLSLGSKNGIEKSGIEPKNGELFLLGEGYDNNFDAGISHKIVSSQDIERIVSSHDFKNCGLELVFADGSRMPLLKNDGYILRACIYADDVEPLRVDITLNAKSKLEVFIKSKKMKKLLPA